MSASHDTRRIFLSTHFAATAIAAALISALLAALFSVCMAHPALADEGSLSAGARTGGSADGVSASVAGGVSASVGDGTSAGATGGVSGNANEGVSAGALSAASLSAAGEEVVTVQATAIIDQESARELLAMVNSARAAVGRSALAWDVNLEQTAIQRAVENVIMYGHTRPDGSKCFTAWPSGSSGTKGENAAKGYTSSASVNQGWTNSSGHYANMIDAKYTTFAAGCAIGVDGTMYWVECFGKDSGTGMAGTAQTGVITKSVRVLPGNATMYMTGPDELFTGWGCQYHAILGDADITQSAAWSVSNTSFAAVGNSEMTVVQRGVLVALEPGEITLTARLGSSSTAATRTVKLIGYTLANATIDYSGKGGTWYDRVSGDYTSAMPYSQAKTCPSVTVTLGSTTLVKDEDYSVSYRIDRANCKGIITVKGKGNLADTSKSVSFSIAPVNIGDATVTIGKVSAYNGKAKRPSVAVKTFDGTTFKRGTDYTVKYTKNKKAGTATAIVTGTGVLKGVAKQTFVIPKAKNTMTVKVKTKTVKRAKVRKKARRVTPITVSKARGTVTYKKVSGSKRLSVNEKTGKVRVKKGTKRGTYKMKVKVRARGTANYKARSRTVTVKVRVK